jgi:hypothetical protein
LIAEEEAQPQARHSVSEHKKTSDLVGKFYEMDMSNPTWLQTFNTRAEELATRFRLRKQHEMEEQIAA